MGEETIEVVAKKTVWVCDRCEAGESKYTGKKSPASGDNQHQCENCGALAYFKVKYPIIKEGLSEAWIRMIDRQPGDVDTTEYLVTAHWEDEESFCSTLHWIKGQWFGWTLEGQFQVSQLIVTHWQPMPLLAK